MNLTLLRAGPRSMDSGVLTVDAQRRYPRLALHCPLDLANDAGECWRVQARNISPGGLQIVCDHSIASRLREQPLHASCHYPAVLHAGVVLPLAQGQRRLTVGLGLNYMVNAEDDDHCLLGFSFVALRPVARRILASFLATKGAALAAGRAPLPR